jgi:hypothetical protein
MIAYDQVVRETNIPSNRNAEIRGLAHLHFVKPGNDRLQMLLRRASLAKSAPL